LPVINLQLDRLAKGDQTSLRQYVMLHNKNSQIKFLINKNHKNIGESYHLTSLLEACTLKLSQRASAMPTEHRRLCHNARTSSTSDARANVAGIQRLLSDKSSIKLPVPEPKSELPSTNFTTTAIN
jgi:hypothetical protein